MRTHTHSCSCMLPEPQTYLDSFLVVHSPNHFHTHFWNLVEILLLNANVFENFDDSLPDTDACVKDSLTEHVVVLGNELWTDEDKLAHKFYCCLAHRCGLVQEPAVDSTLHVVLQWAWQ